MYMGKLVLSTRSPNTRARRLRILTRWRDACPRMRQAAREKSERIRRGIRRTPVRDASLARNVPAHMKSARLMFCNSYSNCKS